MAARTWFTVEKCQGLSHRDCAVLNTAARNLWAPAQVPRPAELMKLRMAYRPGLSARQLTEQLSDEVVS